MKSLITLLLTMTMALPAFAVGPAPKELQGGVITVTLKNGKTYTFSSDEYAVVKRGADNVKGMSESEVATVANQAYNTGKQVGKLEEKAAQPKNILSIGAVRSKNGFDTETTASTVDVKSRKDIGGSLQYQRRFDDNKYVGGRADTNGGAEINVGFGF